MRSKIFVFLLLLFQADGLCRDELVIAGIDKFQNIPHLKKPIRSLVRLMFSKSNVFTGNGVFISPKHVLTNSHIVFNADCKNLKFESLVDVDGKAKRRALCEKMLFLDKDFDAALFETKTVSPDYMKVSKEPLRAEMKVEILSYMLRHVIHVSRCEITGAENVPDEKIFDPEFNLHSNRNRYYESGCLGERGMSGAPIFIGNQANPELVSLNSSFLPEDISQSGAYISQYARLPEIIARHKAEFDEVEALLNEVESE